MQGQEAIPLSSSAGGWRAPEQQGDDENEDAPWPRVVVVRRDVHDPEVLVARPHQVVQKVRGRAGLAYIIYDTFEMGVAIQLLCSGIIQ